MGAHARRAVLDALLQRLCARACTSSAVKVFLTSVTRLTAFAMRSVSGVQRSMMRDLSRWMCVSISPPQHEAPLGVIGRAHRRRDLVHRRDAALLEADVGRRIVAAGDARVADHEIEHQAALAGSKPDPRALMPSPDRARG